MEVMLAGCFVEDLETAKKFYLETLGLSVMFESQGLCEVSHGRGGMVIGLSQSPRPSGQDGAVVCFKVTDLPKEQARLKVRATVGHDSYKRLVNVPVALGDAWIAAGLAGTSPISDPLKNPDAVGLSSALVTKKALEDEGIVEFCRFYVERRKQELTASGADLRKRKKIEDDFTPRLEAQLVGLEGRVRRKIAFKSTYALGTGYEYSSSIEVLPSENKITQLPDMLPCSRSETIAPRDCFGRCEVSGSQVLKHLLMKSEVSDRFALPDSIGTCAATGKRTLWFAEITAKRIRRGTFRSVKELTRAIEAYIRVRNRNPKPFVWTATARSILRKVKNYKETLETAH